MPFTPSHAIAILPFVRTPLAPAALVIGSMAPDIPYFVPLGVARDVSHSLAGAPTIDLLIAAIAFVLWVSLLRAPVLDYAPDWLRERMSPQARWRVRGPIVSGLVVIAALEIGVLSHLLLDLFTHEGGWLATVAPFTDDRVGMFTIANYVHASVSLVAAAGIAFWVWRWALRRSRTARAGRVSARERLITWAALAVVLAVAGLAFYLSPMEFEGDESERLARAFVRASSVVGALAAVIVAVWHARGRRSSRAVHP